MTLTESLPLDSLGRRRIQNRNAQRTFRRKSTFSPVETQFCALLTQSPEKRNLQRALAVTQNDAIGSNPTSFISASQLALHENQPLLECPSSNLQDTLSSSSLSTDEVVLSAFDTSHSFGASDIAHRPALEATASSPFSRLASPNPLPFTNLGYKSDQRRSATPQAPQTSFTPLHITGISSMETHKDFPQQTDILTGQSESTAIPQQGWLGPLHLAVQTGSEHIIHILLERHVSINEKDSDGRTALHLAVIYGYEKVVSALLGYGASVNITDVYIRNSLHYAALYRRENILGLLLDHLRHSSGFDIDAFDGSGWTALHIAIIRRFEVGLQLLIEHGADLNVKAKILSSTANLILPEPIP